MGGSVFSDPRLGGSNSVFGEKEKLWVVCHDKMHLKPPGQKKFGLAPPSFMSLIYFCIPSNICYQFLSIMGTLSILYGDPRNCHTN